jgi:hypothetical protein
MGPKLHIGGHATSVSLPWSLLGDLPVLQNVLPARLSFAMVLMVALLLVLFLEHLSSLRLPVRTAGWTIAVISLIALAPHVPYYSSTADSLVAFRQQVVCSATGQSQPTIVVLPMVDHSAMRWQEQANFCFTMPGTALTTGPVCRANEPCVSDNYEATDRSPIAAFGPKPLPVLGMAGVRAERGQPLPPVTPELRQAVQQELAQPQAAGIALGPMPNQSQVAAWLTSVVAAKPSFIGGTYLWTLHQPR